MPGDLESRELSLAENWHRLNLESAETEKFVYQLWKDGGPGKDGKYLRYKNSSDMAKRLGIPYDVIKRTIKAREKKMELPDSLKELSYNEIEFSNPLESNKEAQIQVLTLRAEKKVTQPELRALVEAVKEAEPVVQQKINKRSCHSSGERQASGRGPARRSRPGSWRVGTNGA